jgi:hypothetical protein
VDPRFPVIVLRFRMSKIAQRTIIASLQNYILFFLVIVTYKKKMETE